jgi:uncharacterized protein
MNPELTSPVPSPCVSICVMDEGSGLCQGCWRTLDEIAVWSLLDDPEKRDVWAALRQRRLQARRPGQQPASKATSSGGAA